jgi:transcription termination/antitermination protein NusG
METKVEMQWYIVRTQNNRERSVAEKIKAEPDLQDKIGEVVVPMETTFYMKDKKKIKREKPMYPGYIFIETNATGELKYFLRGCKGATGFLTGRDGIIKPMSKLEIDKMLGHYQEVKDREIETPFAVGEDVRIIDGPFSTLIGKIEHIDGKKVKVNVSIFGRITPLELSSLQIDKK